MVCVELEWKGRERKRERERGERETKRERKREGKREKEKVKERSLIYPLAHRQERCFADCLV